ncbi:hypothetical protein DFH09DRAFT_1319159 [Mycena vulgaris]|nr:hypothetical protein DFH09DRAFT_1319159 [Mycena vulgaris]
MDGSELTLPKDVASQLLALLHATVNVLRNRLALATSSTVSPSLSSATSTSNGGTFPSTPPTTSGENATNGQVNALFTRPRALDVSSNAFLGHLCSSNLLPCLDLVRRSVKSVQRPWSLPPLGQCAMDVDLGYSPHAGTFTAAQNAARLLLFLPLPPCTPCANRHASPLQDEAATPSPASDTAHNANGKRPRDNGYVDHTWTKLAAQHGGPYILCQAPRQEKTGETSTLKSYDPLLIPIPM